MTDKADETDEADKEDEVDEADEADTLSPLLLLDLLLVILDALLRPSHLFGTLSPPLNLLLLSTNLLYVLIPPMEATLYPWSPSGQLPTRSFLAVSEYLLLLRSRFWSKIDKVFKAEAAN